MQHQAWRDVPSQAGNANWKVRQYFLAQPVLVRCCVLNLFTTERTLSCTELNGSVTLSKSNIQVRDCEEQIHCRPLA